MPKDNTFTEFIGRIRAGDEQAAAELVQRFEPVIRLEVRMAIRDPRLNRVLDSTDVCQSVLASFFVRAASGQFDVNNPKQLTQLLVKMARNKLAHRPGGITGNAATFAGLVRKRERSWMPLRSGQPPVRSLPDAS